MLCLKWTLMGWGDSFRGDASSIDWSISPICYSLCFTRLEAGEVGLNWAVRCTNSPCSVLSGLSTLLTVLITIRSQFFSVSSFKVFVKPTSMCGKRSLSFYLLGLNSLLQVVSIVPPSLPVYLIWSKSSLTFWYLSWKYFMFSWSLSIKTCSAFFRASCLAL